MLNPWEFAFIFKRILFQKKSQNIWIEFMLHDYQQIYNILLKFQRNCDSALKKFMLSRCVMLIKNEIWQTEFEIWIFFKGLIAIFLKLTTECTLVNFFFSISIKRVGKTLLIISKIRKRPFFQRVNRVKFPLIKTSRILTSSNHY